MFDNFTLFGLEFSLLDLLMAALLLGTGISHTEARTSSP